MEYLSLESILIFLDSHCENVDINYPLDENEKPILTKKVKLESRGYIVKRLDVALDGVILTPEHAFNLIDTGCCRCRSNRDTLTIIQNPHALQENGTVGTCTTYFGSRKSNRYMRLYNLHGFNRLELELRKDVADKYWQSLRHYEDLLPQIVAIIRDYIDFYTGVYDRFSPSTNHFHPSWIHTLGGKSGVKLSKNYEAKTIEDSKEWILTQCSSTLAMLAEIEPDFYLTVLESAKLNAKQKKLIELNKPKKWIL